MTKDLFDSGNIVITDRGMGILTDYTYLSKLSLSPGEVVKPGQLVGPARFNGRLSDAHLHWGARFDGVQVDPLRPVAILDILSACASSLTSIKPRTAVAPAGRSQ